LIAVALVFDFQLHARPFGQAVDADLMETTNKLMGSRL